MDNYRTIHIQNFNNLIAYSGSFDYFVYYNYHKYSWLMQSAFFKVGIKDVPNITFKNNINRWTEDDSRAVSSSINILLCDTGIKCEFVEEIYDRNNGRNFKSIEYHYSDLIGNRIKFLDCRRSIRAEYLIKSYLLNEIRFPEITCYYKSCFNLLTHDSAMVQWDLNRRKNIDIGSGVYYCEKHAKYDSMVSNNG